MNSLVGLIELLGVMRRGESNDNPGVDRGRGEGGTRLAGRGREALVSVAEDMAGWMLSMLQEGMGGTSQDGGNDVEGETKR